MQPQLIHFDLLQEYLQLQLPKLLTDQQKKLSWHHLKLGSMFLKRHAQSLQSVHLVLSVLPHIWTVLREPPSARSLTMS